MTLSVGAKKILKATSRTFYIPISRLPAGLQEAIGSAYLCMRAIDEIEDHPDLAGDRKARLLSSVSQVMQAQTSNEEFAQDDLDRVFEDHGHILPEVTKRLGEWACQAPAAIAPRIWDATATMADRMAQWALDGWCIQTKADLDRYTFSVAGAVGLLICDLGAWFDGFQLNRIRAVQFGRGLQMVNILRNRTEDLKRGIDYLPTGWDLSRMHQYARHNLLHAEEYADTLPRRPFTYFIKIPLVLAVATLDALEKGETKLSRSAVLTLVRSV
jgi:farnesyl-diphosphate farnesyltransferase